MIGMGFTNLDHPWPTEVTHIRIWDIGCTWRDIHTAPDTYNWDRLDAVVAKAAGRHLTYVIAATPKWLAKHPDQPHFAPWLGAGSNSMPHSVDEFNKFVWQLATRYKGRIKAYEVWNEPQLADFMFPYNDAECNTLATMQQRAYHTIKSIDPAAVVLSASVLPRTSSGGMNKARRYLTALKRKGWNCDAFACHLYPEVGSGAARWKAMLGEVVTTLKALDAPNTKVWITETSFDLLGPQCEAAAAKQLIQGAYRNAGGRFIYWYAWQRPDLGGTYIGPDSPAWEAIKASHRAAG